VEVAFKDGTDKWMVREGVVDEVGKVKEVKVIDHQLIDEGTASSRRTEDEDKRGGIAFGAWGEVLEEEFFY
jgi:hypothetical protein